MTIDSDPFHSAVTPSMMKCQEWSPVYLSFSKRDGLGVFASRDIACGEAVCYYDGEDLKGTPDGYETFARSKTWPGDPPENYRLGHLVPRTDWGVGQFLNDACKPELGFIVSHLVANEHKVCISDLLAQFERYERKSRAAAMVYSDPKHKFWFFAGRAIKKGEEIYTHYGGLFWKYWFIAGMSEEISPLFRDVVRLAALLTMGLSPLGDYMTDDETLMARLQQLDLADFFNRHWIQTFSKMKQPCKHKVTTKRDGFNVMLQTLFEIK